MRKATELETCFSYPFLEEVTLGESQLRVIAEGDKVIPLPEGLLFLFSPTQVGSVWGHMYPNNTSQVWWCRQELKPAESVYSWEREAKFFGWAKDLVFQGRRKILNDFLCFLCDFFLDFPPLFFDRMLGHSPTWSAESDSENTQWKEITYGCKSRRYIKGLSE